MSVSIQTLSGIAFLPFPEMSELLISELRNRFNYNAKPSHRYGDLIYFEDKQEFLKDSEGLYPYWARTVMCNPFLVNFDSIGEAAGELKKIQRNWAPYQFTCFRRAQLIQEKLPYINLKEKKFPVKIPASPIGLYTLIDEHTLIASAETTSYLPAGTLKFIEDHENPPSRAYLKVQESLSLDVLMNGAELPGPGSKCFEAGACPGGWTWVLVGLGAEVYAVDRAELAPELMKNPLVKFQAHDAFTLKPEDIGPVDWVFSDVICYPERLLSWIHSWLDSGMTKNMICTIKMQGEIDWPLIAQFAAIEGSKIVHLNYNKHELTWMWRQA
ncbi:MAG: SAM-dependent methyltransferase [Treponema sp.]|nr:SAM-dependent methyltransferase [Treponema sp.]